jgi:hypothetical protein
MTIVGFCLGRPDVCGGGALDIEPDPDDNLVVRNRFATNGLDVIYLPGSGHGNCFAHNHPPALATSGGPLPACGRR